MQNLDASGHGGEEIPTAQGLVSHIQTVNEQERAYLARELHDELGGLLVAAVMDLSWVEQHVDGAENDMQRRLRRLRQALSGAVDLKRKIIEELRPTLLDNVGLFAALRWLVGHVCLVAGVPSATTLPSVEPNFSREAAIALFRIAQEGLAIALKRKNVTSADLTLNASGPTLTLRITGEIGGDAANEPTENGSSQISASYEIAAIRHRTTVLGGELELSCSPQGKMSLAAFMPLCNALAA
jgi:signal transduction histidine kinase